MAAVVEATVVVAAVIEAAVVGAAVVEAAVVEAADTEGRCNIKAAVEADVAVADEHASVGEAVVEVVGFMAIETDVLTVEVAVFVVAVVVRLGHGGGGSHHQGRQRHHNRQHHHLPQVLLLCRKDRMTVDSDRTGQGETRKLLVLKTCPSWDTPPGLPP